MSLEKLDLVNRGALGDRSPEGEWLWGGGLGKADFQVPGREHPEGHFPEPDRVGPSGESLEGSPDLSVD